MESSQPFSGNMLLVLQHAREDTLRHVQTCDECCSLSADLKEIPNTLVQLVALRVLTDKVDTIDRKFAKLVCSEEEPISQMGFRRSRHNTKRTAIIDSMQLLITPLQEKKLANPKDFKKFDTMAHCIFP